MTTAWLQRLDPDGAGYDAAAARLAARCTTQDERAELAAYLYLLPELSLPRIAAILDVDVAKARRLVERGSGTTPITAGDGCRGWALVAPQSRRTKPELMAAHGHASLCRGCRNRLHAHQAMSRRMATAGSATFGIGVAAAVARTALSAPASAGLGGLPLALLSGALAVTTGAGALVAAHHGGHAGPGGIAPVAHVTSPTAPASAGGSTLSGRTSSRSQRRTTAPGPSGSATSPAPSPVVTTLPAPPGRLDVPVPVPSLPALKVSPTPLPLPLPKTSPLPLPTVSLSPLPLLP